MKTFNELEPNGPMSAQFTEFDPMDDESPRAGNNLDLLLDIAIPVAVEIGRTQMPIQDVLDLVPGSVVSLDKKAEQPVDLRVNGKLIARGEVVLVDDSYGIRVTQIADAAGRLESLRTDR